jgi:ATP-dependent protease ClpP protease subunit
MTDFFSSLKDNDFYSDKLTHIYFTSYVSNESVDQLIKDINTANSLKNPKPILIHICSSGGSVIAGFRFLSVFKSSKMPIATIIDNYSCSAATFLSVSCPYRIMNKYSFCLLHEYSINGYINNKRAHLLNSIKEYETFFNVIIDMYLEKTKFTKKELTELLQHNLYLDYKTCLSKGVVDRVIDIQDSKKKNEKDINDILYNKKSIHLPLSCDFNLNNIDKSIITSNLKNNSNPYLIYPIHEICEIKKRNENTDENEIKITSTEILNEKNIFKTLNIIPRIQNINNYKVGIIDSPISFDNLIPLLFTDKIYMYKHSFIICNLIYFYNMNNSILLDDNYENTKLLMNTIKTILKQKTKMKLEDIRMINRRFLLLNAEQSKEWGLCHEIIG